MLFICQLCVFFNLTIVTQFCRKNNYYKILLEFMSANVSFQLLQ